MALDGPRAASAHGTPAHRDEDPARLVGDERLPCGRSVAQVWEQARDPARPADPHTATCPHCRQAADGFAALDAATEALAAEEPPSARFVAERVMRAVRAEVRLGRPLPLDDPSGDLRVAENTAAKVLRRAADRVPGARAASCRLTPLDDGTVTVAMTLAVGLDAPLPDRADLVRRAVVHAAVQELGLRVGAVDLRIVSTLAAPGSAPVAAAGRAGSGR